MRNEKKKCLYYLYFCCLFCIFFLLLSLCAVFKLNNSQREKVTIKIFIETHFHTFQFFFFSMLLFPFFLSCTFAFSPPLTYWLSRRHWAILYSCKRSQCAPYQHLLSLLLLLGHARWYSSFFILFDVYIGTSKSVTRKNDTKYFYIRLFHHNLYHFCVYYVAMIMVTTVLFRASTHYTMKQKA